MSIFTIVASLIVLSVIPIYIIKKGDGTVYSNIATTLGVLGTFIGIVYGLLDFDVNNISESVPSLLNGMKFAFITSIVGMITSLVIKGINIKYENKEEVEDILRKLVKEAKNTNEILLINQRQSVLWRFLIRIKYCFIKNWYRAGYSMSSDTGDY